MARRSSKSKRVNSYVKGGRIPGGAFRSGKLPNHYGKRGRKK